MSNILSTLPTELIREIASYLKLGDLISFSHTARLFYNIAIPRIHKAAVKHVFRNEEMLYLGPTASGGSVKAHQTVLEWAARRGLARLTDTLLKQAPEKRFSFLNYRYSLQLAAEQGLRSTVELLFEKSGGRLQAARDGKVPFHKAACTGHLSVVKYLLELGVDAAALQRRGYNAMDMVAARGDMEMARLLVKAGVAVSQEDSPFGRSSIHYAAAGGHKEMVEFLMREGADISTVDVHRRTVLFNAAVPDIHDSTAGSVIAIPAPSEGNAEVVKLFASLGVDPSLLDLRGMSVLHALCEKGYTTELKALLDSGVVVDIAIQDLAGFTALHHAVYSGHREVVDILLAAGAKLDTIDSNGRSLLHVGAIAGQHELLEYLLSSKTLDLALCDHNGWTALHHAACEANQETFDILLRANGNQFSPPQSTTKPLILHRAVEKGNVQIIQQLINAGASASSDRNGVYPLDVAVSAGYVHIVELLLKHGADPNVAADEERYHALHRAVDCGHEAIVQLLLDNGANPLLRDCAGEAAIHSACSKRHLGIINRLLDAGADINATDPGLSTPLHIAIEEGKIDIAAILINKGADLNPHDRDLSETPLHLAVNDENRDAVLLLIEAGADPFATDEYDESPLDTVRSIVELIEGPNPGLQIDSPEAAYSYIRRYFG
ncbi:hypothetical protein EMPG_16428 [Blastomyces silverae]|uniref:F-box domain-containing protein n=1 Tax=Blastomyces silverae TaxID=2060906 RepID=A0A0H1B9K8_9EURO|nr:hypothetical protein EMPG_16428 [Blastomyces silverae]